ncbi:regulator of chromosome condensation 1/beta-lactamase-inhibitor protein II [Trichoderma novae-zelandiae]
MNHYYIPTSPTPTKGKRRTRTSSREKEATSPNSQPAKRANTTITASSPLPSQPAASTETSKEPTSSAPAAAQPVGECGELGLGPKKKASLLGRVVQIACDGMHALVLTKDTKIITWGVNDDNALGRDTRRDTEEREDEAGSDDDDNDDDDLNPHELTPAQVSSSHFPPDTKFAQVAAGDSCSSMLTDNGSVYGWGAFQDSQGNTRFCYDPNGVLIKTQDKPTIPKLKGITQIVCGANHILALDKSGTVWGWGSGEQNQLGRRPFGRHQDTLTPRRVEVCRGKARCIASGDYHCFAIDAKDNVWGWGLNSFGEAGHIKSAGGDLAGFTTIAGGAHHSAAVAADGECLVWGRLDGGQLGIQFSAEQLQDESLIRRDEHGRPRICLRPTAVPNLTTGFGLSGQLGLGSEDDQSVPQRLCGKTVDESNLVWAGAGGQFSVVAHSSDGH